MIHPLLAEMTGLETAGLICGLIFTPISCVIAIIAMLKKQDTQISPQPLAVQIVEELHEQFANKKVFEDHVANNTKRHAEIFGKIESVKEAAALEMSALGKQVASLQVETKMQSEQLKKLDGLEREIHQMSGKIVVDILNAQKIGRRND